jgi:hypothetical protein
MGDKYPVKISGVSDHSLQGVEIEGARDDVIADDEAWCSVSIQRAGERQIGFQSVRLRQFVQHAERGLECQSALKL